MLAAKKAVTMPMQATHSMATGAWVKTTHDRAVMYTPAVTMVAAWIRAETGVGPAIASGSQTYSGICADLPQAPTSSSMAMMVSTHSGALAACLNTVLKSSEPKFLTI